MEPTDAPGNGVVFTSFNSSTLGVLPGFAFGDQSSTFNSSGPRDLNFTGTLAVGSTAEVGFHLKPFDPSAGDTYTFSITQTTTVSAIPGTEPAMELETINDVTERNFELLQLIPPFL